MLGSLVAGLDRRGGCSVFEWLAQWAGRLYILEEGVPHETVLSPVPGSREGQNCPTGHPRTGPERLFVVENPASGRGRGAAR